MKEQDSSGIQFGALATGVALFVFMIMLASLGDRWAAKFPPLPDFTAYKQVKDMKSAFIEYLLPIVEYHNDRIRGERKRLLGIHHAVLNGRTPSYSESNWLRELAVRYKVEQDGSDPAGLVEPLLVRVDIVPVQLAVVQAAKESSWGRSRYAVQVNNLFGEWCYRKGCGIVPRERDKDARHEVRKFASVSDSTRSYMHNLNSHHNYANLRQLRQALRAEGRDVAGADLVDGLLLYSERRQQYVDEIRSMMKQYSYFLRQQAHLGGPVKGV